MTMSKLKTMLKVVALTGRKTFGSGETRNSRPWISREFALLPNYRSIIGQVDTVAACRIDIEYKSEIHFFYLFFFYEIV